MVPGSRGDPNVTPNAVLGVVHTVGVARNELENRINMGGKTIVDDPVPFGPTTLGNDRGGHLHIKQWQPLLAYKHGAANSLADPRLGSVSDLQSAQPGRLVPTFTSFNGINWISRTPNTKGYKTKQQFLDSITFVGFATDTYSIGQNTQETKPMGALVQGYAGVHLTGTEAFAPGDLVEWTLPFWTDKEKADYIRDRRNTGPTTLEHWPMEYYPPKLQRYDVAARCEEETSGAIRDAFEYLTKETAPLSVNFAKFNDLEKYQELPAGVALGLAYIKRDLTVWLVMSASADLARSEEIAFAMRGGPSGARGVEIATMLQYLYAFHLNPLVTTAKTPFDMLHAGFGRDHYHMVWKTIEKSRERIIGKCVAHQRPGSKFECVF
jgi:hypothetical protein